MPCMISQTTDSLNTVRHCPSEGCRWRCTTCGRPLRGRREVRKHWAQFSEGHSFFETAGTGRLYHQTIEGLQRRMMATEGKVDD